MSLLNVAAIVFAASSSAIAQNPSDSTSANVPKGFSAPAHVGRYARTEAHDYGNPEMGVAYQYRIDTGPNDSSYATFYLYQREAEQRDWPVDSVLASAVAVFKAGLEVLRRRGDYDDYRLVFEERDSVTAEGLSKIPGFRVGYVYRRGPLTFVSFYNLFVAGNALLKVRGTVPGSHFAKTDLQSFAHAVVAEAAKGAKSQ